MLLQEFIEQWMEKQCNGWDNNHLKMKKNWTGKVRKMDSNSKKEKETRNGKDC